VEVFKEFTFDAAHWLPNVPKGHKCGRMHGHTYRVVICVEGPVDEETGFVIDFGDLKEIVRPYIEGFDHICLNDLIENPTAENLVLFLWEELRHFEDLPLAYIEVWETPTSGARKRAVPS
jgi:6-pyruvoyltetrahydropterin/6-carboxytetrahydropterin synthase